MRALFVVVNHTPVSGLYVNNQQPVIQNTPKVLKSTLLLSNFQQTHMYTHTHTHACTHTHTHACTHTHTHTHAHTHMYAHIHTWAHTHTPGPTKKRKVEKKNKTEKAMEMTLDAFMKYQVKAEERFQQREEERWKRETELEDKRNKEEHQHEMHMMEMLGRCYNQDHTHNPTHHTALTMIHPTDHKGIYIAQLLHVYTAITINC